MAGYKNYLRVPMSLSFDQVTGCRSSYWRTSLYYEAGPFLGCSRDRHNPNFFFGARAAFSKNNVFMLPSHNSKMVHENANIGELVQR